MGKYIISFLLTMAIILPTVVSAQDDKSNSSIELILPSSDVTLYREEEQTVFWSRQNIPNSLPVTLTLVSPTGQISWTMRAVINPNGYTRVRFDQVPVGSYKMIIAVSYNGRLYTDFSDDFFKLVEREKEVPELLLTSPLESKVARGSKASFGWFFEGVPGANPLTILLLSEGNQIVLNTQVVIGKEGELIYLPKTIPLGKYKIKIFTNDSNGQLLSYSTPYFITLVDADLPSITILSPTEGQNLSGVTHIKAVFSGEMEPIYFYIDRGIEQRVSYWHSSLPWDIRLYTWKLSPGRHKIEFTAADKITGESVSAERNINIVADVTPPLIEFVPNNYGGTANMLPMANGYVPVSVRARDESGISGIEFCTNDKCSSTCPTTKNSGYISCTVNVPVSLFAYPPVTIVAVAYDHAYDLNRGAVGLKFPSATILPDYPGGKSGWVSFSNNLW